MIDKSAIDLEIDENYEFIIENITDLVIFVDPDYEFKFEFINQAFLNILGYTSKDLIGKSFLDYIHSEDLKKGIKFLKRGTDFKRNLPEIRIKAKNERYIWFNLKVKKIENKQKLLLIFRDISKIRNFEAKILENEKRFEELSSLIPEIRFWNLLSTKKTNDAIKFSNNMLQNVIETIPEYIFWKDTNLVYLGCNKNYARLVGVDHPEDIIGKIDEHLLLDKKRIYNLREVELYVMKEDKPKYHSAELWISKDEERIWLDINRVPLRNSKGKVIGILTSFDDITERTITEQKLKESEERFRSLVETTSDLIWEVNQEAIYTYISPKVKDLLGYDPEELIGKTPFDLMAPDEAKRVGEIFQSIKQSRKSFARLENTNIHKNGQTLVLETSGVPIFNEYGDLMGYRGIDRLL